MNHPNRSPIMISLKNLRKSFQDIVAVDNLNLDIRNGEIFGLLGPNGAGKTTTISMLCGLLRADSGEIWIQGQPANMNKRRYRSLIGLCPQDLVIWESLTCLEQLVFTAELYEIPGTVAKKRASELLELLGLSGKRDRLAKTLSGGMKRRLNIALAMVHDANIIILDEPQAGLDPQSRILVRETLRSLGQEKTIILSTHDMDEADRLADRIAIMDHGKLLILDTPENLKAHIGEGDVLEIETPNVSDRQIGNLIGGLPEQIKTVSYRQGILHWVGPEPVRNLPLLLDTMGQNRINIANITIRKKTLEDVFITLTGRGLRE